MDTRDRRGSQAERTLEVVVTPDPVPTDRPVLGPPARPGRSVSRGTALLVVAVLLVLLLLGVLAEALLRGRGDVATSTVPPAKPGPAAAAPLSLRVDVPERVVAGAPATLVVHYADGSGLFSGSTEDWGDQVGSSSVREGVCTAAAPDAGPLTGSYRAVHTWTEPGSYPVRIGVTSYTCADGSAVPQEATATVQVVVAPAG